MKIFKREEIELEDLLKQKDISYFQILRSLKKFIEDQIEEIGFSKSKYKIYCDIRDFYGYKSGIKGKEYVSEKPKINNNKIFFQINKKLVDAYLFDGYEDFHKMELFITIFHELWHLKYEKMSADGRIDNQDLIKDRALTKYFHNVFGNDIYYETNYHNYTEEALCTIYGINDVVNFFKKIGVNISEKDEEFLKETYGLNCDHLQDKTRINPSDNKKYSLDELYEELILDSNLKR